MTSADELKHAAERLEELARAAEANGATDRATALQLIAESYEAQLAAETGAAAGPENDD